MTWPTLNDVKEATIKTLVVMLFFTIIIAVYDSVFSNILKGVLNYFK
ncbi:preprotein translocase subunit SecE [Caloramator sp. mosi_1]